MPKRSRRSPPQQQASDYGERSFWEQRYATDELGSSFEWFAGFEDLEPLLRDYLPLGPGEREFDPDAARLVDLGCGNSDLLASLAGAGFQGPLLGVDYSANVVEQQRKRVAQRWGAERITFVKQDARDLESFADGSVGFVVDKSTMDTLMHTESGEAAVTAMLGEVARVLRPGGLYLLLTQLDPESEHDLEFLTETLLPGLDCDRHHYAVTAHSSSLVAEGEGGGGGRLHFISFRKRPRHGMSLRGGEGSGSVTLTLKDHGGEESDDDDED